MTSILKPLGISLSKVVDPRIIIDEPKSFTVLESASQNTFKTFTTTSFDTTQISFSCPPPSDNLCVDRCMLLSVPFQQDLVGTSPIGGVMGNAYGSYLSVRMKALQQVFNLIQATLNGFAININTFLVMEPLLRFNLDSKKQAFQESLSPSFADYYQEYHDAVTYGQNFNPISTNAIFAYQTGNGNFPVVLSNNTATTLRINYTLTEALFLSPFIFSNISDSPGFYNLSQMDFVFNFIGNLQRLLQFDAMNGPGYTITSIVTSIPTSPTLTFQYLTPPRSIPRQMSVKYPYTYIFQYPTNVGNYPNPIAPNVSTTQVSQVLNLNYIPQKFYIIARRASQDRQSALAYQYTDTYGLITKVSMDFGNQTNLLANMTQSQLYSMTLRNGLQMSYTQATKYSGQVLCIEPGLDFQLEPGMVPNNKQKVNAQFTVTFTNINQSNSLNFEILIVVATAGLFTIEPQLCKTDVAPISDSDIVEAMAQSVVGAYKRTESWGNGDIWSDVKKGFSEVTDIFNKILPIVKFALPLLEGVTGGSGKRIGGSGELVPYNQKSGGKVITREELLLRQK